MAKVMQIGAQPNILPSAEKIHATTISTTSVGTNGSIVEVIRAAATSNGAINIYKPGRSEISHTTYRHLLSQAEADAKLLHGIGDVKEDTIFLLHFDNHADNIRWFWAATVAGFLPCISAAFVNDNTQRKKQITHLQNLLLEPVILTTKRSACAFEGVDRLRLVEVESLRHRSSLKRFHRSDDTAALMLTSGSTGNSKAVCLTHSQMIEACRSKSQHSSTTSEDVFFNWVGLDHVANLVEMHLHAMLIGATQVHVQADDLLADPLAFLDVIQKHRVSITFAPNFFLDLLREKILASDPSLQKGYDLSSLKGCYSGGEANVVQTAIEITRIFMAYGVRAEFIRPGYGLTESCAGITWGFGCPSYDLERGVYLTTVGRPTPGNRVRIVTDSGVEARNGEVGDLQLAGSAVFTRYFNNTQATCEAFTPDGWFITGDRAYSDSAGQLNITGRTKDMININGVKYFPSEIELALDAGNIVGLMPSFTAVFSHRPRGARTEAYCVVYRPTFATDDRELRTQTAEAIDKIASAIARTKPYKVIPLPARYFHKSALGKLSRAKMRKAFEEGQYDFEIQLNESGIHSFRVATRRSPSNAAEEAVLEIICERLGLLADEVSTSSNIFHLGFTSLDFFSFIQSLRSRVPNARNLDLADILWDPTITGVARAIDSKASPDDLYNPVVPLQTSGSKTPLWLVHPASGNVLAFALLANCFTHERPVYGLRCSGVKPGERFFSSIAEIAATYAAAIRRTQLQGPYAIAGYSLGSSIAFEIAKLLEADGQRIAFLGVLDSPPHIAPLVGQLTWSAGLVMVSFFYELIPERYANDIIPQLWHAEPAAALDFIMANSDAKRLKALALDREALSHVADVTANFSSACAKNYAPEGEVGGPVDVFVVDPLLSITDSRKRWVDEYLVHWRDFVRVEGGGLKFHQCKGSHSDMLGEKYIRSFQKTLKGVLAERGI